METLLFLLAMLSLVAFVVGMFNPKTVKCASRGKVALIYIGLFFICAIIGASMSETPSKVQDEKTIAEATSEEQHPLQEVEKSSVGKPVEVGNFRYVVDKFYFRKSLGNEFYSEVADGIYLVVNLSITNISAETRTLDGSLFSVTDNNGVKYEYSVNGSTAFEMDGGKTLFLKECHPNITTRGSLIFEVPQQAEYYLYLVGGYWSSKSVVIPLR